MNELTSLAQYGLTGIAIALIIAIVVIVKAFMNFVKNHIEHNTRSQQRLADTIEQLLRWLEHKNGK